MSKRLFNKLVRDNIPDIITRKGEQAFTHIADEIEYEQQLYAKITEEVAEFKEKPSTEEMADIMEVLRALAELKKISLEETEQQRKIKADQRGGFTKRIILESTE